MLAFGSGADVGSGSGRIGVAAFDPSPTLAVHCGNGFDARFEPLEKYSFAPVKCRLLSLEWSMRRREFLGALGATAAWPLGARAERADKVYRIGYLGLASAAAQATRMKALREGLGALGYIEGKNIAIEERRLEGSYDPVQLAELAAQVVDLKPDVIVTHAPAVLAAKR